MMRSLDSKRWVWWLIASGVLIGIAFNTKMLAAFIPAFRGGAKDKVTVEQLMTHSSGIDWWAPLYKELKGQDAYVRRIAAMDLAYEPGSRDQYWVYHFFIDRLYQGKGYANVAFKAFIQLIRELYSDCRQINLAVHPENSRAQRLYTSLGFQPDGRELWGEPVYSLPIQ